MSSKSSQLRKSRSSSDDGEEVLGHKKKEHRKKKSAAAPEPTRRVSGEGLDQDTKKKSSSARLLSGSARLGSDSRKSSGPSLEMGLAKVAAPSLNRPDFGRKEDDEDTFCIPEAADGEVKRGKPTIKKDQPLKKDPFGAPNPFGGDPFAKGRDPFGGNPFGARRDDSDDDSEDDEEDLFAGANNPFRDAKSPFPKNAKNPFPKNAFM
jgi:hypothetical protein